MIVTRFPPSPTGFLHVGGLRTALYCYLFARQNKGRFILRIEDTDQKRYVEGAVENLIRTLHWAGLTYDEGPDICGPNGPYVQSQRLDLYKKYAQELLEKGTSYYCFCPQERLEKVRAEQASKKLPPKYDRHCLNLSKKEVDAKLSEKIPYVIRQKIPGQESVLFHDHIRDDVIFKTADLDDQVLIKSDGYPTYHLANVVDDHLMEVTHVIRGEEWLSSTPKHILLYQNFGWNVPEFAHLPLLLNKDRTKLSKRQGHVAVEDYIAEGILPEAMVNFIALLGWNPGNTEQEIFTMDDLIAKFSLEKVHKGGAIFDLEKLAWMNWQWRKRKFMEFVGDVSEKSLQKAKAEKLLELCLDHIPQEWQSNPEKLARALMTVEEKILQDPKKVREYIHFYFENFSVPENILLNPKMGVTRENISQMLQAAHDELSKWDDFSSPDVLQKPLLSAVEKLGCKKGQVLWPVRVALTGEQFSPGVFETVWVYGKDETLEKLQKAMAGL